MAQDISWAVITPSYSLDLERCRLLCRSMDAFLSGPWHHYIIVDPPDYAMFKPLAGKRRTVLVKDDILPKGLRYAGKIPFMRLGRFWFSWKHGPVFGWQMQQYIKLLMATHVKEDGLLFCDSDTFFLKPFDISTFARDGRIRFSIAEGAASTQNANIASSIKLLNLQPELITRFWGGDQFVTWRRDIVLSLLDHLSSIHKKPWHEAIGSKIRIAEYHLYSTYVEYVLKNHDGLYVDNQFYCVGIWDKQQAARIDLADFCANLPPPAIAACLQSLIGLDIRGAGSEVDKAIARQSSGAA